LKIKKTQSFKHALKKEAINEERVTVRERERGEREGERDSKNH